ncbi:MAG: hypothetical protein LH473_03025 [Chitinophagales bacterium]|nr:hypothetical protein [Chitinophagales bacterium]
MVRKIPGASESNWYSQMAWSNLYKIAKAQKGNANPTDDERAAQQKGSEELLRMKIAELKPKCVFMFVDYWWAKPFLIKLGVDISKANYKSSYVQLISKYRDSRIIVTARPDSRKRGVRLQKFVGKVLENY